MGEVNVPMGPTKDAETRIRQLNPHASVWKPSTDVEAGMQQILLQQEKTLQSLASGFNLPRPELITFNGDPKGYFKFASNFEANISSKAYDDRMKLSYLIQLCSGVARECIEDCVVLEPGEGYKKACDLLKSRFGRPHIIANSYISELVNGPPVQGSDCAGLQLLADKMRRCELTLTQMGYKADINNTENLRKIVRRLPFHLKGKWVDKADFFIEKGVEPDFTHLTKFIEEKARVANNMYGQDLGASVWSAKDSPKPKYTNNAKAVDNSRKATTLVTQGEHKDEGGTFQKKFERNGLKCYSCAGQHVLMKCPEFVKRSFEDRKQVMRDNMLCDNCFKRGHFGRGCMMNAACEVSGCRRKHQTLLHPPPRSSDERAEATESRSGREADRQKHCDAIHADGYCSATETSGKRVCLRIVPVRVKGKGSSCIETYALLDDGSDVSLCTNTLIKRLGIKGTEKSFSITTVNKEGSLNTGQEVMLSVSSLDRDEAVHMSKVWTVDKLPISYRCIPRQSDVSAWPHLRGLEFPEIEEREVTILIGSDVPEAFWVEDERRGRRKEPYAIRSLLGWTLIGPVESGAETDKFSVNFTRKHVRSELNPADHASRGLKPNDTEKLQTWLEGAEFLWKEESLWPQQPDSIIEVANDDKELKKEVGISFATQERDLDGLLHYFSTWDALQRAVAWLLRYKQYCCNRYLKRSSSHKLATGDLTVKELKNSTLQIVGYIQRQVFSGELNILSSTVRQDDAKQGQKPSKVISSSSPLRKLSPVYDNGVLRVGGRLDKAPIPDESKHPLILPSKHHVTDLIIRHQHLIVGHSGPVYVLASLRKFVWILKGHAAVRRVLGNCFQCRRRKAKRGEQYMAKLPVERLTPGKPPFTHVGVDYFGPLLVKQARSVVKRYGCLFTCLTTRAAHIEIAHTLEADSFIAALHRFISRRGRPETIHSDNGTNFRGAERELRETLQTWNQSKISRLLSQKEIQWYFNPPAASHMGGVWERIIRSIRQVLKAILKEQLVKDETLLTVMAEVEKILNDRPLTLLSDDPGDPTPLTPASLLLLQPNSSLPATVCSREDGYCKQRWRQAQYLADLFWRRWVNEYLPTLQIRQKWTQPRRNFCVNDIVLVVNENTVRGQWPLGRIIEVYPDAEGYVRSARVRTAVSCYDRPVAKLCLLEGDAVMAADSPCGGLESSVRDPKDIVSAGVSDDTCAQSISNARAKRVPRVAKVPRRYKDYVMD